MSEFLIIFHAYILCDVNATFLSTVMQWMMMTTQKFYVPCLFSTDGCLKKCLLLPRSLSWLEIELLVDVPLEPARCLLAAIWKMPAAYPAIVVRLPVLSSTKITQLQYYLIRGTSFVHHSGFLIQIIHPPLSDLHLNMPV